MRRFLIVLLFCGAAAGTALAGLSFAGAQATKSNRATTNISVSMKEYSFTLSANSAPAGTVVFTVTNDGRATHNFSIAGQKTADLAPGQTATLTVNFATPGTNDYVCTIPGHADAGMKGTFTVTGTPPAATTTVNVTLTNFKISLTSRTGAKVRSVKHGVIRFKIKNLRGSHNFAVKGKGASKILSKRLQRTTLTVVLKAGRYRYLCQVDGHAALGMKGVLRVT